MSYFILRWKNCICFSLFVFVGAWIENPFPCAKKNREMSHNSNTKIERWNCKGNMRGKKRDKRGKQKQTKYIFLANGLLSRLSKSS